MWIESLPLVTILSMLKAENHFYACSERFRPVIPTEDGHPFRRKAASKAGGNAARVPK